MSQIIYYQNFENPTRLSKKQLWLIATSAMFSESHREFHDTLLPHHVFSTPELVQKSKTRMLQEWEINNSDDLYNRINYLSNNVDYDLIQHCWGLLSEEELDKTQQFANNTSETRNVIGIVRNYGPENGVYGWQYGLCTWMIRHSFYNNLITEEETWNLLEENGKNIRNKFDSWESFGLSFMIGVQYRRRQNYDEASLAGFKNHITSLLTNKNSPWLNINWNDYE